MLLVNASAGSSNIHGIGLIAREFIPQGTKIWELNPDFDLMLDKEFLHSLPAPAQQCIRYYAYFDLGLQKYILSSDDDRFTNHSEEPNTEDVDGATYAKCDIFPGEEITANYLNLGLTEFMGSGMDS